MPPADGRIISTNNIRPIFDFPARAVIDLAKAPGPRARWATLAVQTGQGLPGPMTTGGKTDQVRITPKRRVTMTDVANLAACSQSTVSIVLNETPGITIARDTRARLPQAAVTLGYVLPKGSQPGPSDSRPHHQIAWCLITWPPVPRRSRRLTGCERPPGPPPVSSAPIRRSMAPR